MADDREMRLIWLVTGGCLVAGMLGSGLVWLLWTALRYPHQIIAGVLLVGFLVFLGWGLSGVRVSVKRREWDE